MSDDCEALVGGGCVGRRVRVPCEDTAAAGHTGCEGCEEPAWVGGGGSACATGGHASGALLLLLLLFVARAAFAVDVQHLQLGAGPIPGVVDPAAAAPWTPAVALGASYAAEPVRRRLGDEFTPLVTDLTTAELAAALQIKDWFRLSVTVPGHRVRVAGDGVDQGVGDVGVAVAAPLGPRLAVTSGLDLPAPGGPTFTQQLSTTFGVTGTREVGFLTLAGQARARLQEPQDLPGVRWGHRLELAGGARTRGRAGLGVAVLAGAPLGLVLAPPAGAWPVEGLGFAALRLAPGVDLEAGAGSGATWGLGSPSFRALAVLRVEGHESDRDLDGIGDLRDLCDLRPEDRDGFRDRDGCPEEDNDRDGLVDAADACPDEGEVFNGHQDADGCPDALSEWRIVVLAEDEPEQLRISVDGQGEWQLEPVLDVVVLPGAHRLTVEAAGHHSFDQAIEVPPGSSEIEVHLDALRTGELHVRLVDPEGRPVAGTLALGDEALEVPAGGLVATLPSGVRYGTATAPEHLPETVEVIVPIGRLRELEVVLEPVPARVEKPPVLFGHDSAELTAEAVQLLDALARWLEAHPDVRLLRIEGHADALGGSAYNYGLSVRRAEVVRDALVARGIAAGRLDPVGSGEARAQLVPEALPPSFAAEVAGVPARDVTFRVLVWDDEGAL